MNINALEVSNTLQNDLERKNNLVVAAAQNNFLETNLGQVINSGMDLGIKAILPDYLEDEVIEIKDVLLEEGFTAAAKTAINKTLDLGKNIIGIFKGDFKNIEEVKEAITEGGLLDNISKGIDSVLNKSEEKRLISSNISNTIKTGKDVILNILDKNVQTNIENQVKSVNKLNTYIKNWDKYYEKQDFDKMDKEYKKIEKELKNLMPLESILNNARKIENLHNLIKNNGQNFNISKNEIKAAELLV